MSLNLNFNFGRLLNIGEKLTTARINAIVRGITATITGTIGTSDLSPGSVTPAILAPGAYFYTEDCTLIGTTYNVDNFPVAPTSLVRGLVLAFQADADNPGPVSLAVAGLGTAGISNYGGKPLVAGDIKAHQTVTVQYTDALLGQPTWQMVCLPGNRVLSTEGPVQGSARNLVVKNNAVTPASQVDLTADEVLLKDGSGMTYLASAVNVTANVLTTGANGLDTGALTAGTWYYVWVIYDAVNNTVAALLSASATAPTLPGTYTFRAMLGTVHAGIVGGSTTDFMTFHQLDNEVWILDTAVFTGKAGVTAWTAVSGADLTTLQALVPPIAKVASGSAGNTDGHDGGIAIGGDANGLGASVATNGQHVTDGTLGYTLGGGWRAPLITAQTLYYIMADTGANWQMSISGYRL